MAFLPTTVCRGDKDIVLMIDDWLLSDDGTIDEASFGSLHDWSHGGRLGNWLTVNGQSHPTIDVPKNARIRLRLINAANARIFGLNIPASAFLIAEDGYPTPPIHHPPEVRGSTTPNLRPTP